MPAAWAARSPSRRTSAEGLDHVVVTDLDARPRESRDRRSRRDALRRPGARRVRRGRDRGARARRADRRDRERVRPAAQPADLRGRVRRGLPLPRHGDDLVGAAPGASLRGAGPDAGRRPVRGVRPLEESAACSRWSGWASSPGLSDVFAPLRRRSPLLRRSTRSACATAPTSWSTATTSRRRSRSGPRSRSASTRRSCGSGTAGSSRCAPFSEPETFVFPEGIGPIECVHVEHEEVLLIPQRRRLPARVVQVRPRRRVHRGARGARTRPACRRPRR